MAFVPLYLPDLQRKTAISGVDKGNLRVDLMVVNADYAVNDANSANQLGHTS